MANTGKLGGDLRGNLPSPSVIALTDIPGHRKVIKLLEDGKYLKVEGGFIVCRDPAGGGGGTPIEDHLVIARNLDLTKAGGLQEKTIAKPGVTLAVETGQDGIERLAIGVVPPTPPAGQGSDLIMCHEVDPTVSSVNARFVYQGTFGCSAFLFQNFTEGPGGTWTATRPGRYDFGSQFCDGVTPQDGDIFVAYNFNAGPDVQPLQQIFKVVDCGEHQPDPTKTPVFTIPVVQRADQYATGSQYKPNLRIFIEEGLLYANKWLHLLTAQPIVLDTTELLWEVLNSYSPNVKEEALTDAQVVVASTYRNTISNSISASSGLFDFITFTTRPGTPGVSTIPSGWFKAQLLYDIDEVGSGNTNWQIDLYIVDANWAVGFDAYPAPFLTMVSPAMVQNTQNFGISQFETYLSSPVSMSPSQKWAVRYRAQSTSVSGTSVRLSYDNFQFFPYFTRLTTTVPISSNTGDHKVLTDSLDLIPDYLAPKLEDTATITWTIDSSSDSHRMKANVVTSAIPSDHLVKARNIDATTVGGLLEKTVAKPGVTLAVETGGDGVERLAVGLTPVTPPGQPGSDLIMCHVKDPKLRDTARCVVLQSDGSNVSGLNFLQWTQISGEYKWQYNFTGKMAGYSPSSPGSQVYLNAGDRIVVPNNVGNSPSSPTDVDPKLGLYEVVDPGSATTQPIIQRTSDANTPEGLAQGTIFEATESPGFYWEQVTPGTIVVDVTPIHIVLTSSSYVPNDTQNALTGAQVAVSKTQQTALSNYFDNTSGLFDIVTFTTLPGTPSATTIPAGVFTAKTLCGVGAPGSGLTWFQIDLYIVDANWTTLDAYPTPFLTMDGSGTKIINNPYGFSENIFSSVLAADVSMPPGKKWAIRYRAQTTSTASTQIVLDYDNFPFYPYYTKISTTVQMPATGGTNDHLALLNTAQDVAQGQTPDHPACAIGAGRLHTPYTTATYDAGTGVITCPADTATTRGSNAARVGITGNINGVDSTGWMDGDQVEFFVSGCSVGTPHDLISDASVLAPAVPVRTIVKPGTATYQGLRMQAPNVRIKLRLDMATHVWWLERITG